MPQVHALPKVNPTHIALATPAADTVGAADTPWSPPLWAHVAGGALGLFVGGTIGALVGLAGHSSGAGKAAIAGALFCTAGGAYLGWNLPNAWKNDPF